MPAVQLPRLTSRRRRVSLLTSHCCRTSPSGKTPPPRLSLLRDAPSSPPSLGSKE
ncbi:hypothetical protein E2562_022576, partial [Oryza meyeriana var. granulata]